MVFIYYWLYPKKCKTQLLPHLDKVLKGKKYVFYFEMEYLEQNCGIKVN